MIESIVVPIIAASVLGLFGWAFQMQTKVQSNTERAEALDRFTQQKHTDLKEFMAVRFDAQDSRLGRIESVLNGRLYDHSK